MLVDGGVVYQFKSESERLYPYGIFLSSCLLNFLPVFSLNLVGLSTTLLPGVFSRSFMWHSNNKKENGREKKNHSSVYQPLISVQIRRMA